jgi:hypothetical protein
LCDAARLRVAEARIDRAVQLLPEASSDRREQRDVGHRERHRPVRGGHGDRSWCGRHQRAEEYASIRGRHFNQTLRDDAGQLVPFQIERAGIVGLELEPSAFETYDFARNAIAIRERDDVGAPLGIDDG